MLNLVIKDILIQKKYVLFGIVYAFFTTFIFQGMEEGMYSAGVVAVTYLLVSGSCAYDEKNKADILLNSLPYKRSDIVIAKYVSTFVFAAIGIAAYACATLLVPASGLRLTIYPVTPERTLAVLFSVSLLACILFPIYFKLGYIKAKIPFFILFFVFFFGISNFFNFMDESGIQWLENLSAWIKGLMEMSGIIVVPAFAAMLLLVSYSISIKFYRNRNF